jgi:hypothetical protein
MFHIADPVYITSTVNIYSIAAAFKVKVAVPPRPPPIHTAPANGTTDHHRRKAMAVTE